MILAFRLYGNFQWPPSPAASVAIGKQPGHLEVWLLDDAAEWRAALRFVPGDGPTLSDPLTQYGIEAIETGVSASDKLANQTAAYLNDSRSPVPALWLDDTANAEGVTFRGAFLLEEFGEAEAKVLQLPLANQVIYGNSLHGAPDSIATFSGLRAFVDQNGKPSFALHLHLPLPVRQAQDSEARTFPVSLEFLANPPAQPHLPLRVGRLLGGWLDDEGRNGTGIELSHANIPAKDFWFGNFGFSERGSRSAAYREQFVIYALTPKIETQHYWPRNADSFGRDLAGGYGFNVEKTSWFKFSDSDPADLSLRFARPENGVIRGFIYRVRIERKLLGSPGDDSEDLNEYPEFPGTPNSPKTFTLRLSRELGGQLGEYQYYGARKGVDVEGWIRTGKKLSADCCVGWDIEDRIWNSDRTIYWRPTVTLRLHWPENISSVSADGVTKSERFKAGLIGSAAYTFGEVRSALPQGETGYPVSFLPDLALTEERDVRFCLYGTPIAAEIAGDGVISWGQEFERGKPKRPWTRPAMRLTLANVDDLIANTGDLTEKFELELDADQIDFFRPSSPPILRLTLSHDASWPPAGAGAAEGGFFSSFVVRSETAESWSGRLASLDFTAHSRLAPVTDQERRDGFLRIGGNGSENVDGLATARRLYPQGRAAAQIRLPLRLSEIRPVTVEVQRFDRSGRPAPLLIDLSKDGNNSGVAPTSGTKVLYWLIASETILPREDRKLSAEIFDAAPDVARRSYAVLSAQPFAVFRYTAEPMASRGDEEGTSVAVYDGDTRTWQYKLVSRHYRYSLPPQAIAESADKPGRLEIHDLVDSADDVNAPVPLPFVRHLKNGKLDEAASSRDRRAVEYRLTPSAEMWIAPSDVARGYFLPEASTHDIFRQYGAYGLGAALAYLRAEFLYGLSVGVDVSKEGSVARGSRVAEIEAIVGRLTGPARDDDAEPTISDRWEALRSAIARRPERLEIWARDPDSDIDFAPARFTAGATFALRGTAIHRAPVIDGTIVPAQEGQEAISGWPVTGLAPWPPHTEEGETGPSRDPILPRHHPQGLSGGALWPVESLNLFNTLLMQPQSSGGTIERIALSPIGGDATQKAEFLNGLVAIISETYNGRVQRLQVEVIGRVQALWHRAKHVIVYERTVNPSAQFAPKVDPDRSRSRRPILRKVREYIELLQPERGYPDFGTATIRHAGFLSRVRFNSRIINVDSAWSSEVGDYGWQIPLWNKLSARERPQVYPMPDVAFVTAAEGDGDSPVVAQDCTDVDQLYFFADFKAETSDTDRWEPRLGLDYANMPAAQAIAEKFDPAPVDGSFQAGAPEERRTPVGRILPGLRRFTWRLAPAAQKTAINAGRIGKPVYVGVESVSLMRATHQETAQKSLNLTLKAAAEAKVPLKVDEARYWSAAGTGVHPGLTDAATTLKKNMEEIGRLNPGSTTYLKDVRDLVGEVVASMASAPSVISGMVPDKNLLSKVQNLASGIPNAALCQKLKNDATSTIRRKELLVRTALAELIAELDAQIAVGQLVLSTKKSEVIDDLQRRALDQIAPLFEEASQDVTKVGLAVEKARSIVQDAADELDALFKRARGRLQQFRAGYDETKPWSPERLDGFRKGAEAAIGGVVSDIDAAIAEASGRLAVELGDVGQQIAGHIAKALQAIKIEKAEVVGEILTFRNMTEGLLAAIDADLSDASPKIGRLTALKKRIESHPQLAGDKALREALTVAVDKVAVALQRTHLNARTAGAALDRSVNSVASDFVEALNEFEKAAAAVGADLNVATQELVHFGTTLINLGAADLVAEFDELQHLVKDFLDKVLEEAKAALTNIGTPVDAIVMPALARLDLLLNDVHQQLTPIPGLISGIADDLSEALNYVQTQLSPSGLIKTVLEPTIRAALEWVLQPLPEKLNWAVHIDVLRRQLQQFASEVADRMRNFSTPLSEGVAAITDACNAVAEGVEQVEDYLDQLATKGATELKKQTEAAHAALDNVWKNAADAKELITALKTFDRDVRRLHNDVSRAFQTANAYSDRVFDAVSKIGHGGLSAAPSNLLKLYSAVTSAPELAALKSDIERIRSTFDELGDIIGVTKTNAMFNRLGDELKALGLSIPFDRIGDRLLPADLSNLEIGNVFRSFGGAKLDRLFKGYKIPAGVRDAVKITHDFDKKQARAWVQVDIAAPFPGRRSLFSLGAFRADFVDMQLTGRVRLEASKDQEKVAVTGFGHIATTLDAVVGGQSMVKFEKFGLDFNKEKGLDVQFDPKNAKLNPQFKWIQDFLSGLFPDLGGGLEWIRENGIPVGVQHDFVLPPLSLTFGTSGVSNISIENHFRLVAFPDFVIADRFNLSTIDRPFIFSIFIIGGTGYIQIEADYKPIKNELMVLVEAGAGGSAQLAFAFGPFIGQIFITISGVLSYRKVLGKPGGGLTISMVLVITGQVDVCGIVTVGITLMLRMSYRDNGQVDADGTLTVTIRISRFFKLSARAQVKYKLRGGKSETTTSAGVSAISAPSKGALLGSPTKFDLLERDAKRLEGALK